MSDTLVFVMAPCHCCDFLYYYSFTLAAISIAVLLAISSIVTASVIICIGTVILVVMNSTAGPLRL